MTIDQRRRGGFEERLLDELRSLVVAEPSSAPNQPGRRTRTWVAARRRRRLALVGGVAALLAVAAAAGVPFLTDVATPAYAVNRNDDGTVTVEINSLSDAAGLESKLREAGIRAVVQYLPPGKACKQPWFTPASPEGSSLPPGSEPEIKPGPAIKGDVAALKDIAIKGGVEHTSDGRTRFTISNNLPADETLVIMTQTGPGFSGSAGAGEAIGVALAKAEVEQCEIVDAPVGSQPFGPPPGGGQLHTETGSPAAGPSTSAGS